MPERIYISTEEGTLKALNETQFSKEDELQALIAEYPELLDGEQIRPGDPRRWILITREKGIASSPGEGARWAVDHLIIDQNAVPTLVEVKRGKNPEIRRSIVGQMLEYAAHASETWSAADLRSDFEEQTRAGGVEPGDALADLLQGSEESDVDRFWDLVSTNLAAKRLRLLFVADDIPDPLAEVVTFLNAQMQNIEVLAVEIKRFEDEAAQTLVPRVIGRGTAGSSSSRAAKRGAFLERFESKEASNVANRLLEAAEQSGAYVYYGNVGVSIRVNCPARQQPITVAWLYPHPCIGWMRARDFSFGASIRDEDLPELRVKLEQWVDQFAEDNFTEDVSSSDTKAWAVSHDAAVRHEQVLTDRLGSIISELKSM
ncbi:MAG: hypothetical protein OXC93_16680 [Rhodospirillaceae bacterium]|nr:hypothetical protein [Rhodospirillaceae bacterium]